MIKLNLGCGINILEGFTNIDILENIEFNGIEATPDMVADVTQGLPYGLGTVDEIYCGHLLEHLEFDKGQSALSYWFSLLRTGGVIGVTVPNFDYLAKVYLSDPSPEMMMVINHYFIFSYIQPEALHKYVYGESLLQEVLAEAGFVDIERLDDDDPHFHSKAEWQIGLGGRKP